MAQLPPKVPSMSQNWHSSNFHFQMMPMPPTHQNSWVDDFIDFSSARRSSHRRSASDSIAFVEAPFMEDCRNNNSSNNITCNTHHNNFDGLDLDDEQLRNMFSDDVAATGPSTLSSSNPSTPSDQNSENEEKNNAAAAHLEDHHNLHPKNEPGEVDKMETQIHESLSNNPSTNVSSTDAIVDPKRIKRILANRQSAQRSRVRKLQYISELERSVTTLQTEVSALSPRVAFLDHQRLILNVDNSALKQRIAALAQDKIFKDAYQEALRKEIERLRQVYHEQNMKKMANKSTNDQASPPSPPLPPQNFIKNGVTDQE
ncbi:hypothetical protein ACH5RR_028125 [Cinchona calisaya]|uniref:BZIP domain-containing protein n=1 Tax=Cinchona calisaya TaxID=153742 RepID=A0ABD2YMV3_9GENT